MMIIKPFTQHSSFKYLQVLSLLFSMLISTALYSQDILLDEIAAIVNDDVVMFSEVRQVALQAKQKNTRASDKVLIKDALEALILNKIQLQHAKNIGIVIDDTAVDRAMLSIASQNKLNLIQFKEALEREGLNYKKFRESTREKIYLQALRKNQQSTSKKITEIEIDELIQSQSLQLNRGVQFHLLDILVPAPNGTSVQQFNHLLSTAQLLRKQLLKTPSNLSSSLINNQGAQLTDLGWQSTQSLSPTFIRTLSLLSKGELSNVVRDQRGFHILKIIDQRGGERKISQQARVRHILISAEDPQANIKIKLLRNQILAGKDFSKLAKENSADKSSAQDGGNLGMMDPSSFVPPFAKAVRSLPLNSLSQPIRTKFGWHIIEVLERKTIDKTREALKAQAQSIISETKKSDEANSWLQSLRDEAFVEYRINL